MCPHGDGASVPHFSCPLYYSSRVLSVCVSSYALTPLHDCGPLRAAGVEKDVLVKGDTGQENSGGPGSSPEALHSLHSLWSPWREQSSSGKGEGPSRQHLGKLVWGNRLAHGALSSRGDRRISTLTVRSPLLHRTSARTPTSLWMASAPTTCTRARWETAGLWRPAHRLPPESRCGRR